MSNLKIYQLVDGVSTPFPNVDSQIEIFDYTYNAKRMGGAPSISATVKFATCLDDVWTDNVYVEFKGEKYFLKQTPTSSYSNEDARYKHELELVSERIILDNVYFYDVVSDQDEYKPVTNSSKVAFFGTIHEFAQRMNYSLQYAKLQTYVNEEIQGYHVIVDDGVESEGKLITFEDQYFSNVLQEIYNVYELPYYFIGKEIHIGFKDSELSQTFQYGLNNELLSITKTNANAMVVNRATGQGSADNIPYYYPNMSEKGDMQAVLHTTKDGVVVTENVTIINGEKYGKLFNPTDTTSTVGESLIYTNQSGEVKYIDNSFAYIISKDNIDSEVFQSSQRKKIIYHYPTSQSTIILKIKGGIKVKKESAFSFGLSIIQNDKSEFNPFNSLHVRNVALVNNATSDKYMLSFHKENDIIVGFKVDDVLPIGEYTFSFDYIVPYMGYVTGGSDNVIPLSNIEITTAYYSTSFYFEDIASESNYCWYAQNADKYFTKLSDVGLRLKKDTTPNVGDTITQEKIGYIQPQETLMPPIYRESEGEERFYNALNETYEDENGEYIEFPNPYLEGKPKEVIVEFQDIKPTIVGIKNKAGQEICKILDVAFDQDDNNETEEIDGTLEYKHPYFFVKLAKTDGEHPFNIFDSAIDEGEMTMAMTSGHCGGCEFTIMVSDDDLKMNTVQVDEDGNLVRDDDGNVLCGREPYQSSVVPQDRQNDTIDNEVWIALKKDEQTFGRMVPEGNIKPIAGDTFVILHINLPQAYIKYAEDRLEKELIKYIRDNNEEKFTFSIKFSRIYLAENPEVANAITENALLNVSYNGYTYPLYVSSYSYKVSSNDPLPEITVELKDEITVNQNAIQNAITEVKGDFLQTFKNIDIIGLATPYFLRKDINDRSEGKIAASLGFEAGGYAKGKSGAKIDEYGQAEFENITSRNGFITDSISTPNFVQGLAGGVGGKFWIDADGKVNLEVDNITARQSLTVMELIIQEVKSVGGELVVSASNGEIEAVTANYIENSEGINVIESYTIKLKDDAVFMNGDLIRCSQWDMANNTLRSYWVQFYPQTDANGATGNTGIVYASDFASNVAPQVGDKLVQMGNVSNTERQGVIIISALNNKPYISVYDNVSQPNIQIANLKGRFGNLSDLTINGKTLSGYGIWSNNAHFSGSYTTQDGSPIEDVIKDSVDNISIGGRNLLLETNRGTTNWSLGTSLSTSNYTIKPINYNGANGVQFAKKTFEIAQWEVFKYSLRPQFISKGKTYHLSFDAMQSAENAISLRISASLCTGSGTNHLTDLISFDIKNVTANWTHYDITFNATQNGYIDGGQVVYMAVALSYNNEWVDISFANMKLEEGTKSTAWTPAPEDVQNDIGISQALANNAQLTADNAQNAADEAQADAYNALLSANKAKDRLNAWAEDGVISPLEKQGIKEELVRIDSEYNELSINFERANIDFPLYYENAYNAYRDILNYFLTASDESGNENVPIPNDFAEKQEAYYAEKYDAYNTLYDKAVELAEDAQGAADAVAQTTAILTDEIATINKQLDGVVESWFGADVPTQNNYPANQWVTNEEKENHLGDTYTNNQEFIDNETTPNAGKSWRWVKDGEETGTSYYFWTPIADSDAVRALLQASQAQDTADGKRRVFVSQPTTPYDEGDLWVKTENGATTIYFCTTSKAEGNIFSPNDWSLAATDDSALDNFKDVEFANYKTTVEGWFNNTSSELESVKKKTTQLADARNLLLATNQGSMGWTAIPNDKFSISGTIGYGNIHYATFTKNVNWSGPQTWESMLFDLRPELITNNGEYMLSFDVLQMDGGQSVSLRAGIMEANATNVLCPSVGEKNNTTASIGQWVSMQFQMKATASGVPEGNQKIYLAISPIDAFTTLHIRNMMLLKGTESLPYQPAYEDSFKYTDKELLIVNESISEIKQTSDSISLTVASHTETIAEQSTKIGNAENAIQQNIDNISDIDDELNSQSTRITNVQSQITQTATEIRSEVYSKTEVNGKVEALQSQITQNANSIALKVSQSDVNNTVDDKLNAQTISTYNIVLKSHEVLSNTNYLLGKYNLSDSMRPSEGEEVTLSFSEYIGNNQNIIRIYNSGGMVQLATFTMADYNPNTKRFEKTFNWVVGESANNSLHVYQGTNGVTGGASKIYNVMLTKSNKATAWQPSPEDADAKITEVQESVEQTTDKLLDTGIDIEHKKITVTANDFTIKNNRGDITSSVDAEGNWSTNALRTMRGEKPSITANYNNDNALKFYYPNGNVQMEIGYDTNSNSLMRYYDENGSMLWKIGNEQGFIPPSDTDNAPIMFQMWKIAELDEADMDSALTMATANIDATSLAGNYYKGRATNRLFDNNNLTMPSNGYFTETIVAKEIEGGQYWRLVIKYEDGYIVESAEIRW